MSYEVMCYKVIHVDCEWIPSTEAAIGKKLSRQFKHFSVRFDAKQLMVIDLQCSYGGLLDFKNQKAVEFLFYVT